MQAYKFILWACVACAAGILICILGSAPFYWDADGYWKALSFGWLYQMIIGIAMLLTGIYTVDVATNGPKLFRKNLYSWLGTSLILAGLFVLANIDRYEEVFAKLGTWPIYVMGVWIAVCGILSLTHYLTVFEPPTTLP